MATAEGGRVMGAKFGVGDLIVSGSGSAGGVLKRVDHDPTWKTSGLVIQNVNTERYGGNPGMTSFVPDYLLSSWRLVPLEWSPVFGTGGALEERYVWATHAEGGGIRRELRKAAG